MADGSHGSSDRVMRPTLLARFTSALSTFVSNTPRAAPAPLETPTRRTVGDLIRRFWETHWSRLDSGRQTRSIIEHYILGDHPKGLGKGIADVALDDLTPELIFEWHAQYRAKHRSANRALKYARQAFRAMMPRTYNPFVDVKPYTERRRKRSLTESERHRFVETLGQLRGNGISEITADAIWLLYCTGARKGEALKLRIDQVDFDARQAVIDEHKTDDVDGARIINLGAALEVVRRRCEHSRSIGSRYVFPGNGKTGHLATVQHAIVLLYRTAGIVKTRDLVLHTLRRNFASAATSKGTPLPVVQKCLGHLDPATTAGYTDASAEDAQRATDSVGEMLGAVPW
jgi:integrase